MNHIHPEKNPFEPTPTLAKINLIRTFTLLNRPRSLLTVCVFVCILSPVRFFLGPPVCGMYRTDSDGVQVMWIRRTTDKVSLLTVGNNTYSGDPRIKVKFQYPNNWRLHINPIKSDDAGLYMCQVSTHPPRVFATNLTVLGKWKGKLHQSWVCFLIK